MDLIAKKLKKYAPTGYITLQKVRVITDDDQESSRKWLELKAGYETVENNPNADDIHYMLQTFLNMVLNQERVFFILSRDYFRGAFKKDNNWTNSSVGFSNDKYSVFLNYIQEEGIVKFVHKGKNNARVYELIEPEVLAFLKPNIEKQREETINYANKYKGLEGDNTQDGLEDGLRDGLEDRVISNKKEVISKIESKSEKMSFEQLLFIQHPDSFPSFDELDHLAQLAVENVEDFDVGRHTMSTFEGHLKGMCKKISTKQKKYIENLVQSFEFECKKYYNLKQAENMQLKEPTEIKNKAIKKAVDDEDAVQSHTLDVLKATFGKDKIKILKGKLDKADDPNDKARLEAEIQYWEKIL